MKEVRVFSFGMFVACKKIAAFGSSFIGACKPDPVAAEGCDLLL
ncbi:hypothetical protein [Pseudomonas sp. UYIF39]|nr:hypothetical protein [Pseudomonas sp. UYIF39]